MEVAPQLLPGATTGRLSTKAYLFGLIAAVLVPVLVFAAFLLTRYARTEQARFEQDAVQIARQVALVTDGELAGFAAMLQGLAASSALASGDFAQFYTEARRLIQGSEEIIVLRELGTRQILNTERPFGAALPAAVPIGPGDMAQLGAGRKLVSDVYASPLSGEPRIAVALPIARAGAPLYVLAITFPTTRIRDALVPAVPADWIVTVGDRRGTIVSRSVRHEEVSGRPGLAQYLEKAAGRSGIFTATSFEGTRLLAGYYRSNLTDWLFGANIPEAVVEAPLWRSLMLLASLGAVALALSVLLAYLFGATFTAAAVGLARRAEALGEGLPVPPISSLLTEFVLVSEALSKAAAAIEQRAHERDRSEQQRQLLLNELNHRVKNTLATVQSIVQQTLRTSSTMAEANEAAAQRLIALAHAHDVLTRENWEGAELHDILVDVTRPHGGPDRISTQGPPVWLPPSLALSLALALHELATNASKYGGLSRQEGSVSVSWQVKADEPRLFIVWREHGGPSVQPATRRGFGTRLIERSSADVGGTVVIDYKPEGLVCTIEVPIPAHGASEQTIT